MKPKEIIILIIVLGLGIYFYLNWNKNNTLVTTNTLTETNSTQNTNTNAMTNQIITIETSAGNIELELYPKDAPLAVENFTKLAEAGFYNDVIFHRVIKDFMIQGGDPTGTGRGGPGYTFADELNSETDSYKNGYKRGTLAMANAGPNTNGSQFFIMHKDQELPHLYTIFGKVLTGIETVDKIAGSTVDGNDKPTETIKINKITIKK